MVALVDDEDFERINKYNWYSVKDYNTHYAVRNKRKKETGPTKMRMHNFIIEIPKGMVCDHINHNGLDNRKENLRAVTTRQNAQNRWVSKTSIYPGVNLKRDKWIARMRVGDSRIEIGYFNTELEAFEAYCNALKKIGETCLINEEVLP